MNNPDPARYRPCVGAMLVNRDNLVFVGQRLDNRIGDRWQMPQGGIDPGEDLEAALLREVGEETGAKPEHLEVVTRLEEELYYDLPTELQGKLWGGQYVGQRQIWFLVRFTGTDKDINITAYEEPEFAAWKWVAPQDVPGLIVSFKRHIYDAVLERFSPLI